jgi:hypothetical protein
VASHPRRDAHGGGEQHDDLQLPTKEADLHARALARLNKKRELREHLFAYALGKPCLAYAVDAGRLSRLDRWLVRHEASRTELIVTRARAAADRLRAVGVTAPIESTADDACTFEPDPASLGNPPILTVIAMAKRVARLATGAAVTRPGVLGTASGREGSTASGSRTT